MKRLVRNMNDNDNLFLTMGNVHTAKKEVREVLGLPLAEN